jgi:hypothetical protein
MIQAVRFGNAEVFCGAPISIREHGDRDLNAQ